MNKTILSLVAASVSSLTLISCKTPPPPPPPPPPVNIHHFHTVTPKPSAKPEDFKAVSPPHSFSQ